jgi:glycolate oxidase FAD binding subunit
MNIIASALPLQGGHFRPANVAGVVDVITDANAAARSLEIFGGGTKRSFGDHVRADALLDMSGLTGIEMYEPEELVIKVRAGTPMSLLRSALAEHKQNFAFEPPDYAALFGNADAIDTIGGIVACNLSGPRRVLGGAARDSVLGIEGVNGRGEAFHSGGRTVKNVTGFDIPRLMTGSFGVLAALTSITLKVHPAAQYESTLVASELDDSVALRTMSELLQLPFEISAAAHLGGERSPASVTASMTAIRIEGFRESVMAREAEIEKRLRAYTGVRKLGTDESRHFWASLKDLSAFTGDNDACIWRLSLPCGQAASVAKSLGGPAIYDWGGSRVFVQSRAENMQSQADALRKRIAAAGGSASLLRATPDVRSQAGTFQPRHGALREVGERLRRAFDPNGVLNPGKLASLSHGEA